VSPSRRSFSRWIPPKPVSCRKSVTDPGAAGRIRKFYQEIAIPAESCAPSVAFAIGQAEHVDVNEILFPPTRQEL
jgi:NADP-dependent 3-hydroxy acid dehydrogenase YdfG